MKVGYPAFYFLTPLVSIMRIPRIYTHQPLQENTLIELEPQASQHLSKVLRMNEGAELTLFNGSGGEYSASISQLAKKQLTIQVHKEKTDDKQSPLDIHLGIAISKGDRMDWVMQKATEIGITQITPLYTERTEVKLKGDRAKKKTDHWQQVIISACEQSARNRLMSLKQPSSLSEWLRSTQAEKKFVLHHRSDEGLNSNEKPTSVALLIGPEGGLSNDEINQAQRHDFSALTLGPRVLRTETAPIAAASILQYLWGDY
mgnify:CR=1 FL=1